MVADTHAFVSTKRFTTKMASDIRSDKLTLRSIWFDLGIQAVTLCVRVALFAICQVLFATHSNVVLCHRLLWLLFHSSNQIALNQINEYKWNLSQLKPKKRIRKFGNIPSVRTLHLFTSDLIG